MRKVLYYYLRYYTMQYLLIFLGFAAFAVVGVRLVGRADGMFGSYASMIPLYGVLFIAACAINSDVSFNVAVSMGMRRSWCFWAAELSQVLSLLVVPLIGEVTVWLTRDVPGADDQIVRLTPKNLMLLYLCSLLVAQLALLASRVENARLRGLLIVPVMIVGSVVSVLFVLLGDRDLLAVLGVPAAVSAAAPWFLAAVSALLGLPLYQMYRKAVVRL